MDDPFRFYGMTIKPSRAGAAKAAAAEHHPIDAGGRFGPQWLDQYRDT
jgi:hypothetical protein